MITKISNPIFDTITIIGAGLIGSSIARASEASGVAKTIRIYDTNEAVRACAAQIGLGDVSDTIEAACTGADLVVLCTPVGVLGAAAQAAAPFLKEGAILTDVGSVKESALNDMVAVSPAHVHVIAGHPIAGTEHSGPDAGFAKLFSGRWCILTPLEDQSDSYQVSVQKLSRFWEAFGSTVEIMSAKRHDLVLAITSHLPHLIAYNICATAEDMEQVTEGEVVKFSAGGFRDFTRIAASDPTMWRDVFLNNKEAVLETLGRFTEDLAALQRAIRWSDGDQLFDLFTRARSIRKSVIDAGQDTAAPNFGRRSDEDDTPAE
ncbi:prephenate/arogenate dehydrogenase family protein [Hirschia baltica]|uniref:prephenate dehydrogenase n=1 Tax=Hirschia baltica (strain ATCC 49814 / DSM 5838 / IFAM 1418) TaxID=582402 RepID=C6XLM4_HIRBI|nr:prephenate/arogenate dehydrogenase family protein [Hirschia baltica]ACT57930.1 Arogenate dehydrogenase [Hirschia baltica ATCC 49814]